MTTKTFVCEMCGKEFEAAASSQAKYCHVCRKERYRKYLRAKPQAVKPNKSLDKFMHELSKINAEREKAGQKPLTYGEYSVMLWFGGGR